MKFPHLFAYPAATVCLVLAASAESRPFASILKQFHIVSDQSPLSPDSNPANQIMPPAEGQVSTGVIISDVIGKTQSIAVFSGLTRDIDSVAARLDNASQNATVLAPDNAVMKELKRKPWEDPEEYKAFGKNAYEGGNGQERAHANLKKFVEAHVVAQSPWEEGQKATTLAGNEVWFEVKDGIKKIQPYGVKVSSIADKVSNGEVWVLGGALV